MDHVTCIWSGRARSDACGGENRRRIRPTSMFPFPKASSAWSFSSSASVHSPLDRSTGLPSSRHHSAGSHKYWTSNAVADELVCAFPAELLCSLPDASSRANAADRSWRETSVREDRRAGTIFSGRQEGWYLRSSGTVPACQNRSPSAEPATSYPGASRIELGVRRVVSGLRYGDRGREGHFD